jgi:recombination protein RecT
MTTSALKAVATGQEQQQPRSIADLSHILAGKMKTIKSVIASTLTPEKMARIALNELRQSDYLAKIAIQNPGSFINAVTQAAHLGLEIGGALGQAYLVPYKGEIKMMPGYRGLISLARRSGEITSISAEVVYENDEFDLALGIDPKVSHKPCLKGPRGEPVLAYMVARFKFGGHHFEWMTIDEIMAIKARSSAVKSGKSTPWDTDRDEMIRKTVVRRGWKYLPMSIEMQGAAVIEAANDQGRNVTIDGDSVVVSDDAPQGIDQDTGEINDAPKLEEKQPQTVQQHIPKAEPATQNDWSEEDEASARAAEVAEQQQQQQAPRQRRERGSMGVE